MKYLLTLLVIFTMMFAGCNPKKSAASYHIYIGSYTKGDSEGLYRTKFDPEAKTLAEVSLAARLNNPAYQTASAEGQYLFSIAEFDSLEEKHGGIVSYKIDHDGALKQLAAVASRTKSLTHISYNDKHGYVASVSLGGGDVVVYPVDQQGRLGPQAGYAKHDKGSGVAMPRQEFAHPHSVFFGPSYEFIYVPDLGMDAIVVYKLDKKTGAIDKVGMTALPPGGGPRHMSFHPSGKYIYVNNEMASSVSVLKVDTESGLATLVETVSALSENGEGNNTTGQILVGTHGKFLYVSNREHNNIAIFSIDRQTGKLTNLGHEPTRGERPRNFTISPDGRWLAVANRYSDNLVIFKINEQTGMLEATGLETKVPSPSCVTFVRVDG